MRKEMYRYEFQQDAPLEEIEEALLLAILATESLHGEAQVRLDAAHYFDPAKHACIIDASTAVGKDVNRLFTGFLVREFGRNAFKVKHVEDAVEVAAVFSPRGGVASTDARSNLFQCRQSRKSSRKMSTVVIDVPSAEEETAVQFLDALLRRGSMCCYARSRVGRKTIANRARSTIEGRNIPWSAFEIKREIGSGCRRSLQGQ